ncbi:MULTISPECIES: peptide chain release factor 1 [Halobacteriovorax]|uniref:Peptide chain release factor 1 n=1 Tax=Halobacteriovorax vibrionivorans TaxID=2152716 RepID=A0ABY0IJA3_9BACT|nr:peptide chain release factor 1 [Halobacteriovorax sp. BALOs_7]RZF22173.1 peptide chain release factor 1 [Halobacteriovorax vibrionivorans]TGD48395.1 peptide chain release factor 1 [Halobacteriovorax sp. Y22]
MFDKLDSVVQRFEVLTEKMADPTLYERQTEFKQISEERSNLEDVVVAYKKYKQIKEDIAEAKEMLKESDPDMKEMAKEVLDENEPLIPDLEEELKLLLLPKDPLDNKNCMVEIRAGAGGDEASIFSADVLRMYQNYARALGWKVEIESLSENDEGIKEVIFSISGEKVYSKMKYESGVHRVQRVPKTESQGRVHTSTITVAVMPETDDLEWELDMNDVRVEVMRASGSGGQHVNTTDSAVRMTHIPTGIAVYNQDQKSQLKNKEKAKKILAARIFDKMLQEKNAEEAAERKGLIGTGDRSERIRTYNFPQGRLTDHRIGLTLYSLDKIIEGDLAPVIDALIAHNQAELLKGQEE